MNTEPTTPGAAMELILTASEIVATYVNAPDYRRAECKLTIDRLVSYAREQAVKAEREACMETCARHQADLERWNQEKDEQISKLKQDMQEAQGILLAAFRSLQAQLAASRLQVKALHNGISEAFPDLLTRPFWARSMLSRKQSDYAQPEQSQPCNSCNPTFPCWPGLGKCQKSEQTEDKP